MSTTFRFTVYIEVTTDAPAKRDEVAEALSLELDSLSFDVAREDKDDAYGEVQISHVDPTPPKWQGGMHIPQPGVAK